MCVCVCVGVRARVLERERESLILRGWASCKLDPGSFSIQPSPAHEGQTGTKRTVSVDLIHVRTTPSLPSRPSPDAHIFSSIQARVRSNKRARKVKCRAINSIVENGVPIGRQAAHAPASYFGVLGAKHVNQVRERR